MKTFVISEIASVENRSLASYKIRKYFQEFVYENITKHYKLNSKVNFEMCLHIKRYPPQNQYNKEDLRYEVMRVPGTASLKIFFASILIDDLEDCQNWECRLECYINGIFRCLTNFFTQQYKKIKIDYLESLISKIDYIYLRSIPYPAPFAEQDILGDSTKIMPNGDTVKDIYFRYYKSKGSFNVC